MIKGSLADRIEYAILETLVEVFRGEQQGSQSEWRQQVMARGVPESEMTEFADLLSAFNRLRDNEVIRLEKLDNQRFNVAITDKGRKYWGSIKEPPTSPIGFAK